MVDGLTGWYESRRAAYPWRSERPDPYAVLVSEVMLQQTQAARVVPAFERFMGRFADVESLAAAPVADVIRTWAGLGYNRRAVSLSNAARAVIRDHGGRIPSDPAVLQRLPGVGPYTSAAIASLAFGRVVPAIDTNVRRVVARAVLGTDPGDQAPAVIRSAAEATIDHSHPGVWNQAVMDLGREVCRPVPRCDRCPLARGCRFRRSGGRPTRSVRRQSAFEGSFRQVRGAVVRSLAGGPRTVEQLAAEIGRHPDLVARAVAALASEGLAETAPGGAVRLPE